MDAGPEDTFPLLPTWLADRGVVYALDLHPLAIQRVQEIASKRKLTNVETIRSNCKTGLPENSLDVVLLYDIFHMSSEPDAILAELHRVLKPDGMLSFSDHHMGEDEILSRVTVGGLFRLSKKGKKTYSFSVLDPGIHHAETK